MSQDVYPYPLDVVSRYRDPQLQVDKNTYWSFKLSYWKTNKYTENGYRCD